MTDDAHIRSLMATLDAPTRIGAFASLSEHVGRLPGHHPMPHPMGAESQETCDA